MGKKKYWQSFGELNQSEGNKKLSANEFQEDLPFASAGVDESKMGASRRDFLKYLGFSTAAAMAAASCETPVRKIIPYVNKPQDMVPGIADWYATTYINGGEAVPIIAKVRDGRPIKIEGNTLSSITKGGTSARVQASVLDLYDTARLRGPKSGANATSWEDLDRKLAGEIGGNVVLLTSTITSPTTKQIITDFLAKYPGGRHVQFDQISYSGMLLANEATYGKRAIPSYKFENAKVIVSLGADFLGTWLSPVEFQIGYSAGRKINEKNPEMSKHYHFESMLSMTGANADVRTTHRPSEAGVVAAALLSAVNGGGGAPNVDARVKAAIDAAAADLKAAAGKALVVSGSNNRDIQIIVNAINEAIGANGTTIDWSAPVLTHQGVDADFNALVADMEAQRVSTLLIYGVNPAYAYYDAERFKKALARVKTSISFNERVDETTELCKYALPAPHFLESWGDAEPRAGFFSMIQPTIYPLFKTRPFQETLLKWTGNTSDYETYFRNYWTTKLGSADALNKALQDGVVEPTLTAASSPFNGAGVAAAVTAASALKKNSKYEVVVYSKVSLGDGSQGNNPWLLELPDPITRATWDNYAVVSPQLAKEVFDIDLNKQGEADDYEVNMEKPSITLKVGGKQVTLPVLVIPGTQANTIAVAVGYGRKSNNAEKTKEYIGRAAAEVGQNVFPFLAFNGTTVEWQGAEASAAKVEESARNRYRVATVQTHGSYEGRHEVVKEFTLAEFKQNPEVVIEERNQELSAYGGINKFPEQGTIYPIYERPGIKWGMSIDLNACYGCGACVVACHAENNVPVVGKSEVLRFHDMHWLRIDRYYSAANNNVEDADSVQVIFQPMLCQHCDNAPCENVCPVAATNHNSEGINQMIYNRCIGTRYCANNCPYKVRRFNWADYTGADSFKDNQLREGVGKLDEAVFQMNDDLTRMVLNPDVTVRSRGVIEKCSFCVQRLQEGKLKAKKENRPIVDSDVTTACAQACAADAIVFGNANDPESIVSKSRSQNSKRVFYALEQIHTLPNINYLAKVRNTKAISAHSTHEPHEEKSEGAGHATEKH